MRAVFRLCDQVLCSSQQDTAPVRVLPGSHHQAEAGGADLLRRLQGAAHLRRGGNVQLQ